MSEAENPVTTILRLIDSRIRVIKDNGSVASVLVTEQNYDRELLKGVDAQITVGLDRNLGVQDQRLSLSGSLRRRIFNLRCVGLSVDRTASGCDTGKTTRTKLAQQISAIIRENRTKPYQTIYNYYGSGYPEGDPHKIFDGEASSELLPSNEAWLELSVANYQKVWTSDDDRHSKSASANSDYAQMLFRFKIEPKRTCVKQLALSFEGYGSAPSGLGATIKIYNHLTQTWEQPQTGESEEDQVLNITLTSNIASCIDDDGYVWLLARTTNPADESTPAVLYCDFAECTVQVYGLNFCDVVSYVHVDETDVKPFLWKVEFLLRGWYFENISG